MSLYCIESIPIRFPTLNVTSWPNLLFLGIMVVVVMVMVALVSGQDARAEARGQEKKKARGGLKWEKDGRMNE